MVNLPTLEFPHLAKPDPIPAPYLARIENWPLMILSLCIIELPKLLCPEPIPDPFFAEIVKLPLAIWRELTVELPLVADAYRPRNEPSAKIEFSESTIPEPIPILPSNLKVPF
jgi:hypothetical protein